MSELRDLRVVPSPSGERSAAAPDDSRQQAIMEAQKAIQIIAEQVTRMAHSSTDSAEMTRVMKESAATLAQTVPVYTEAVSALQQREQRLENATARLQESVTRFQTQQMDMAARITGAAGRLRSWLLVTLLLAAFAVAAAAVNTALFFLHAR